MANRLHLLSRLAARWHLGAHSPLLAPVATPQASSPCQPQRGYHRFSMVKIGTLTNQAVGFDGGKQVKGRKRHLLVDTLGLVLMVVVTAANVSDQAGAKTLFVKLKRQGQWFTRLFLIYGDGTYGGKTFVR